MKNMSQAQEYLADLDKSRRRLTREELETLYGLALHPDPLIRCDVAALLIDHYEEMSENVLIRLTYDRNPFVRTDAVDSLCIGRGEHSLQRLVFLAQKDPEYTVRGCAVHSIYDVCVNRSGDSDNTHRFVSQILTPLLENESNRWVMTCYYCVLCLCGEKKYLQPLLDCLDDEDDYVRTSVLDSFEDILDEDNESDIEDALQYYLPLEQNETLVGKMTDLLMVIQDYYQEEAE